MRPFRICKHVEDQDGRTNRQIQEQKRALKKLPWKRKSLVLAVFVLLRGRFRERFRRNGKRDLQKIARVLHLRAETPILYRSFFPRAETREWKRFNGKGSMCLCASEVSARGNAGVSAAMESGT